MSLDFEYGINIGNRFTDLLGHDEDPDDFIARQSQPEEKSKKTSKDVKSATTTTTTKKKTTTPTATATTTNVGSNATKTNKENLTGKSQSTDVRRQQQQSNVLGDNNNQQTRPESGRGGGRGSARRGGSAGQDRPPYEGGSRGGGAQRYNKFEGQQASTETSGFDQGGDGWRTEGGSDTQQFGEFRGRGRGRGNYEGGRGNYEAGRGRGNYEGGRGRGNYEGGRGRGNYEGGRGRGSYEGGRGRGNYEGGRGRGNYEGGRGRGNYEGGRGRGRGGRGNFNNRNTEEDLQQQPPTQESNTWETSADANFDNNAVASTQPTGQDFDTDAAPQERPFEAGSRRGGRGQFRSRTFHNNRNYGSDRPNQYEREGGDQDDPRRNRRQHDRQPRSFVSGVKPIEKKDGEGAHNWGSLTENPDDNPVVDETADTTDQAAPSAKGWAEQVEEAEKQMTLDEYKKQIAAKKRAQQEKLPQFNTRVAGEGEDPKSWKPVVQEYRKKNDNGESEEGDEGEEADESEGNESEEETEEQISGKKKVITIPLRFNPIEMPRGGSAGTRGGSGRGGSGRGRGRYRDRPDGDEHPRSKSPSQQQPNYYQQTGEYHNDEPQSRPYRGGPGRGSGRGEYRRSYGNSARGSRGGYNRASADSYTPDFDNTNDFPTLPK